jgi:hypothetical protein
VRVLWTLSVFWSPSKAGRGGAGFGLLRGEGKLNPEAAVIGTAHFAIGACFCMLAQATPNRIKGI